MFKKLTFFVNLIILINLTNFTIAEIIPLKKPIQTKIEKEQKLLFDVIKPLPKPITREIIKKKKDQTNKTESDIVDPENS